LLAATVFLAFWSPSVALADSASLPEREIEDVAAVESLGLLGSGDRVATSGAHVPTGGLNEETGLTVTTGGETVVMSPTSFDEGESVGDGTALHYSEEDYGIVLTGQGSVANAGYIVINEAGAPGTYSFDLQANGEPAVLVEIDGTIQVKDPTTGEVVNVIDRPWARDAEGLSVDTWYSVDGSVLTQHVDHLGASYPVVADPRMMCDFVFCTAEYSKAETRQLASESTFSAALITAACTFFGTPIAGTICGLTSAYVITEANKARNKGKCFGMRYFLYSPAVPPHAVSFKCYA